MIASAEKMLINRVRRTIERHRMLKGVKRLVIAFSSGPDSVCLLDILHRLYKKKIKMHLVYVDHGLRPKKTMAREAEMTKRYASRYRLPYQISTVRIDKKGIGTEAAARAARYCALTEAMSETKSQRVALAHNLDDLLETFLMNLIRGSGSRGLAAIPAVRLPLIRPLINLKKCEILEYLKRRRLTYSCDRTNKTLDYRRNLIRLKIIPALVRINPRLHETVLRTIEILKQDDTYLEEQAGQVFGKIASTGRDFVSLDLKNILRYNRPIVMRVIMKAIRTLCQNLDGFESKHFETIYGLKAKPSGKVVDLPKGVHGERSRDHIIIYRLKPVCPADYEIALNEKLLIEDRLVVRTRVARSGNLKVRGPDCEVFDLEKLVLPLLIRKRREGDQIVTKMGRKRLKKIFNEARIPRYQRDRRLMLCDANGVLWVFGIRRAARGLIDKKTKRFLVVKFEYLD